MRHPLPSLLEVSLVLTLMSAAPAAAADPRFSAPVHATTGLAPSALVTADFNGDTKPDLATTDMDDSSVFGAARQGRRQLRRALGVPHDALAMGPCGRRSQRGRPAGSGHGVRRRSWAPRCVPERRRGSLPSRGLVAPDRRGGRRGRRQRRPRRGSRRRDGGATRLRGAARHRRRRIRSAAALRRRPRRLQRPRAGRYERRRPPRRGPRHRAREARRPARQRRRDVRA